MGALIVVVIIDDVEAEPSGRLLRTMLRGPGEDVELIGPHFVESTAALRELLGAVCERTIDLLESPPAGVT